MRKYLTTTELAEKINQNKKQSIKSFAILPVGCTEQHGPYLPLETDSIIADEICLELEGKWDQRFWFWKLPTIPFTSTKTNLNYSGTVSVSENCFRLYLSEICNSIFRSEFDGIFIFCAHGSVYNASSEVAFNMVWEQFDRLERIKRPVIVYSITQFDEVFTDKTSFNTGQHADWREFLLLYKLLKNELFNQKKIDELQTFQKSNEFSYNRSKIFGIPMEKRSVNGVLGDPFPFAKSENISKLAEDIWNALSGLIKSSFVKEIEAFYKLSEISG